MKTENKSLVPYTSNYGLNTLENSFNGLFDRLFDEVWQEPSILFHRNWRPTDITEDEKSYRIEVELPGFKKNEIKVTTKGNSLVISAKNNKSSYTRAFSSSGADLSKIESTLENGVLTINIAKTLEAQEKVIDIKEVKELLEEKTK